MLPNLKKQVIPVHIRFCLPVLIGLLSYLLYALTHASGMYWTHPNSIIYPHLSKSSAFQILFQYFFQFSKIISTTHPMQIYQNFIAFFAALTISGTAAFSLQWSDKNINWLINIFITLSISLFISASPAFWSAAVQGRILLLQACLLVWSLVFWNRFFLLNRSRWNACFGAFIFGIALGISFYIIVILIIPFFLMQSKFRTDSILSVPKLKLTILMGCSLLIGLILIRIAMSPHSLNTAFFLFSGIISKNVNSNDPAIFNLKFHQMIDFIHDNIGIAGFVLILVFMIIPLKQSRKTSAIPFLISAIVLMYTVFLGWACPVNSIGYDVLFLSSLFLMIPVFTLSLNFIMHRLPRFIAWIILLPVLFLVIHRVPGFDLSRDSSYQNFAAVINQTIDHEPDPYSFLLPINHDVNDDSTALLLYQHFMKNLTYLHTDVKTLNMQSKFFLAGQWGRLGELLYAKSKTSVSDTIQIRWRIMALHAFYFAYRLDDHSSNASHYTGRIAQISGENRNYNNLVNYFLITVQLNPCHFNANAHLYQINRHMGNQHQSLYHLRRMIKTRPDSSELKMELVRYYLDYGFFRHARLNYDAAVHSGACPSPDLEARLPSARKTRWIPRNPFMIH